MRTFASENNAASWNVAENNVQQLTSGVSIGWWSSRTTPHLPSIEFTHVLNAW
jgi:hypothetical protein